MKMLLRCGYLALIVLGVVIQLTRGQQSHAASDSMATLGAGLDRLHIQSGGPAPDNFVTGNVPSCPRPIHFVALRVDGSEDDLLRALPLEDDVPMYVYLGSVQDRKNEVAMIGRWVWASAMFEVGLRSTKPDPSLILVLLPRTCPDLGKIDWAALSPRN